MQFQHKNWNTNNNGVILKLEVDDDQAYDWLSVAHNIITLLSLASTTIVMIGELHVASFECTPIAYLSWLCVVIHVESDAGIVHDIMLGWTYYLGERRMKTCDQELLLG